MNKGTNHTTDPFSNLKPPYSRSKEHVWDVISEKIGDTKVERNVIKIVFKTTFMRYAVAALVAILIGVPLFMRLYTTTVDVALGEHAQIVLPDGSKVYINAGSNLNYHPYWWAYNREVQLSGEAYFEVTKGEKFVVKSAFGETSVLGTTFNIYARDNAYNVACLTGSVKVSDYNSEVILKPMQKAEITNENKLLVTENIKQKDIISWTTNEFIYTGESLIRVISDINLQYGITINIADGVSVSDLTYTGNFNRSLSAEKVLYFVFKPFGLKTVKKGDAEYVIEYEN